MGGMKSLPDILGLFGVLIILLAYFFSQIEKWKSNSLPYLFANLVGSLLIAYSLMFTWNLAAFTMEVLWALISIIGILKNFFRR